MSPRARCHPAPDFTAYVTVTPPTFHPFPDFTPPQISPHPRFHRTPHFTPPQIAHSPRLHPSPDCTPRQISPHTRFYPTPPCANWIGPEFHGCIGVWGVCIVKENAHPCTNDYKPMHTPLYILVTGSLFLPGPQGKYGQHESPPPPPAPDKLSSP